MEHDWDRGKRLLDPQTDVGAPRSVTRSNPRLPQTQGPHPRQRLPRPPGDARLPETRRDADRATGVRLLDPHQAPGERPHLPLRIRARPRRVGDAAPHGGRALAVREQAWQPGCRDGQEQVEEHDFVRLHSSQGAMGGDAGRRERDRDAVRSGAGPWTQGTRSLRRTGEERGAARMRHPSSRRPQRSRGVPHLLRRRMVQRLPQGPRHGQDRGGALRGTLPGKPGPPRPREDDVVHRLYLRRGVGVRPETGLRLHVVGQVQRSAPGALDPRHAKRARNPLLPKRHYLRRRLEGREAARGRGPKALLRRPPRRVAAPGIGRAEAVPVSARA
mmetsp:Transcript_19444/g.47042  ORF Transcript_19444/g.47042 Transcript_19444/m.47042 type:complete len:330 (+) Transcript_19444:2072-3061(+)